LMLVMFGVGVGNLAGMAALTGVMVIEKAIPGGKRLSPFVGVILLLLGVLWLVHPIWLQRAGI
jgi:predicted metal-binding membrane protein